MNVSIDGQTFVLQEKWIRHTHNPVAPRYPKTGDRIRLVRRHQGLPPGDYVVAMVEEWEPPAFADPDGRDIRISVMGLDPARYAEQALNGMNLLAAMGMDRWPGRVPAHPGKGAEPR